MYCTETQTLKARIQHRCTSCGESILPGYEYSRWMSQERGEKAYSNKMHPECKASHQEEGEYYGEWEYTPFSYPRPERNL